MSNSPQAHDRAAQTASAALARRAGHAVSSHLARSAVSRVAGRAASRGLTALLFKAGGVLGAKGVAIGAVVLLAIALLVGLIMLILSTVGAAFQSSTAVWPVSADVRADGTYLAGGWAISSRFGWRQSPFTGQAEFHDGIDIVSPTGSCPFARRCPLPAMFDGLVSYVGWDQTGASDPQTSSGGQVVIVENGQEDHRTLYAHLEPYRLYVQLQGRIEDPYGRYGDQQDYQAIGRGELTPDLDDGAIEMWCALDMPGFRATRSGPGTVEFAYDRPAQCRTSVVWGQRGQGWEGWSADDPPVDGDGHATLAWQTPVETGKRAGDVALRFRAHLVPPPPPPTASPPPGNAEPEGNATEPALRPNQAVYSARGAFPALGQGSVGQGWSQERGVAGRGLPASCERQASGVLCRWALADIPFDMDPGVLAHGTGSVAAGTLAAQQALTPTPTAVATHTPILSLVSTSSRGSVPIGGSFSVAVSLFDEAEGGGPTEVRVGGDGALRALDASASSGTCTRSAASATCQVSARPASPATISLVFEVLPGSGGMRYVTISSSAAAGERRAHDAVYVEIAPYAVTPGPWPPPTVPPPPTWTPLPTSEPSWPTPDPDATVLPTATPTPLPPGQGPGSEQVGCAPQTLVQLPNVVNAFGRTDTTRLIVPAAAAFQEVRAEIVAQTGQDPLSRLADALRPPEFRSDKPGVARMSWHMAGRAIDLDTGYPWRRVPDGRFWRLSLGATDVTAILERHGFRRIPDRDDSTEWWHYEYRADGIAWASAMLQVYPLSRLAAAFPEVAWTSVGCQRGDGGEILIVPDDPAQCAAGSPAFASAVEELPGCGPPVRAGDRVFMLDSTLGFVGMTGQTTGPHLHLGMQVRSYDGQYHQTNICTPDWLQGMMPPPGADCWTAMADPEAFLPHAPPPVAAAGAVPRPGQTPTAIIPEGAPFQLPPPNYPGSLLAEPAPEATPIGQYWSPYADGGRYGGGSVLAWFTDTTCGAWSGFPWCNAR